MNYAIMENGVVTNIIWLHGENTGDFPDAVPIGDIPATIGDTCTDGTFYRNGVKVYAPLDEANTIMTELDNAVVDLSYQNALLELGVTEEG